MPNSNSYTSVFYLSALTGTNILILDVGLINTNGAQSDFLLSCSGRCSGINCRKKGNEFGNYVLLLLPVGK